MKTFNLFKFKKADFRLTDFLVDVIHLTFFYVSLQHSYHISISLIDQMSLKLGKIRTRSWRPKWPIIDHYFCNIWKTRPDSETITIEQNVQIQVGIYQKIQLAQIQTGRPAATFDFNMLNNWKTVPNS